MQFGLFFELLREIVVPLRDEEVVDVDFDLIALGLVHVAAPLFYSEFGLFSCATGSLAVLRSHTKLNI